jgi:HTH-type transcriptional regulator / antitoxin HipB
MRHKKNDLERYVADRKARDPEFADGFEEGYVDFEIGVVLRQAREKAGMTQEQLARHIHTKKTAISRIENHGPGIRPYGPSCRSRERSSAISIVAIAVVSSARAYGRIRRPACRMPPQE